MLSNILQQEPQSVVHETDKKYYKSLFKKRNSSNELQKLRSKKCQKKVTIYF